MKRKHWREWIAIWVLLVSTVGLEGAPPRLVISAYQGPCQDGDFAANLATVRRVTQQALDRKSDFLVFPEAFLSGYATREAVRAGARSLDDPTLQQWIGESAAHEMVILVGLARREQEQLWNTVLVVHRGKLLGTYDKVFLTGGDRKPLGFEPGRSVPVFEAKGVRFAVQICHDSSFPHVALAARLRGAMLLFSPHYNYIHEDHMDQHRRWVRRTHIGLACHMRMVVVRSNVVVTNRLHELGYGDSFIMSPRGEILAEARLFRTELITAEIPPEMVDPARSWAKDDEVPEWLAHELAELLTKQRRDQGASAPRGQNGSSASVSPASTPVREHPASRVVAVPRR